MRDFYREARALDPERIVLAGSYNDYAVAHDEMPNSIKVEVREWLDLNTKGEVSWDVWPRDFDQLVAGLRQGSYVVIFQFEDEADAAMFKLRWPIKYTRQKSTPC